MADNTAFSVSFIINPLISLYRRVFAPATTSSLPTAFTSQWANWFYAFLNFLCFSPDQFNDVMAKFASSVGATTKLQSSSFHKLPQRLEVCPTVLLRANVPSSGFTVTFRALLDSGADSSFIQKDLATLLVENGATLEYIWPRLVCAYFFQLLVLKYRKICKLTLQSVENASLKMTTSVMINECFPFTSINNTPVDLVVKKMASLGLPMVESGELGRTMWSEDEPNSQYRVDMIIGQDLLNAHFNIHPIQPTYHITPSLAIIRTKMGLVFLGQFDTDKFRQWTLSTTEVQKMKEILYPNNTDEFDISAAQKEEINNILTLDVSDTKKNWIELICSFFMLSIYIHLFITNVVFGCLLAFLFKCFLSITFLHRLIFIKLVYTSFLSYFSSVVNGAKEAYESSIIPFFKYWICGSSSVSLNLMQYIIPPRLAVTVKSDTCTKTVWAYIDTGAGSSFISAKLAKELNVEPFKVILYADNDREELVNIEIGKPNGNEFTKVKLALTSIYFSKEKRINSTLYSKIANVLSIPLFDVPEEYTEKLLIGNDLIPSLLYPSPSRPNRCISLASNLNLIETRLGYYFQGTQLNSDYDFFYNWLPELVHFCPFNSFTYFVLITVAFVILCFLDLLPFYF